MAQGWMKARAEAPVFPARPRLGRDSSTRSPSSAIFWPGAAAQVLVVHDDDPYCAALAADLRAQDFSVVEFDDPQAALTYVMNDGRVDAVLIDADLPDISGIDLLTRFRGLGVEPPAAVAAAAGDEEMEEAALEYGAADFLNKSRSPSIGAKRLRLLIGGGKSSNGRPPSKSLIVGPLELRLQSHRALWRDTLVPLTVTEFKIVRLLVARVGEEVPYREIYDVVHGAGFMAGDGQHGYRSNVRSLIRKIRNRFCGIDPSFSEIENYPGFGYRWRGPADGAVAYAKAEDRLLGQPSLAAESQTYAPPPWNGGSRMRASVHSPAS